MIDHIGLNVSNLQKSKEFYTKALSGLKYEMLIEIEGSIGFGENKRPDFWISQNIVGSPVHICFRARNRMKVDEFYRTALAAGGKDNGAPGIREAYHPDYYAAFILDPDGHNIEAVCHEFED